MIKPLLSRKFQVDFNMKKPLVVLVSIALKQELLDKKLLPSLVGANRMLY